MKQEREMALCHPPAVWPWEILRLFLPYISGLQNEGINIDIIRLLRGLNEIMSGTFLCLVSAISFK